MNTKENIFARLGLGFTAWAEKWFPDSYVFAALAVFAVAAAALANGSPPAAVAKCFGDGFWSLSAFMLQMAFVIVSGYVAAVSPPVMRLIDWLAGRPRGGRGAVAFIAAVSMLASLLNYGFSLVLGGLLVRAIARRRDLRVDYRAAGAAAYLGLGATWALGLSSSAAQLQATPASLPKPVLAITGVIPFSQTIFLPQSLAILAVLLVVSTTVAYISAPHGAAARTDADLGVAAAIEQPPLPPRTRPGEWLEYAPLVTILLALPAGWWLAQEFAKAGNPVLALSNLNTYNFAFLMLGLLLHWRPVRFLRAVAAAVPASTGVLIQFPLYGSVAAILTAATGTGGRSVSDVLARGFLAIANHDIYPLVVGLYSAVLGFFIPSGGGKWILEAPYVMQAANSLQVHLGWIVQTYNVAEALPNLVNPFWMLPLLGVIGLKARDIVGFSFLQFVVHLPLVLLLLWALGNTLTYVPPVMP